jgi:hypothetical protein
MSDYSKLLALFDQIAPLQKETELVAKGLDAAALNETRNATYHLLIALRDSTKCEEEIKKAENHAKRAIYDCHEDVVITDVVSDYLDRCKKAGYAMDKITEIRKADAQHANDYANKYSPDRNKQYEDIAPHLDIIKENNQLFEQARTELNKRIRKENYERRWALVGKVFAVLTLVIAVCAWLFPGTPT